MTKAGLFCSAAVAAVCAMMPGAALSRTQTGTGATGADRNAAAPAVGVDPAANAATDTGLGDIVVTARRTTENLQKAPASIVSVSGQELVRANITDPQLLEKVLPSANLHTQGPVVQTFIRGVGSRVDTPNLFPGSIIVYDGLIVPRYGTFGLLFDLASVQSIAGPQGTLYGGSAAGGAINVNTAQPSADTSGSGLLEAGNYSSKHAALTQNISLNDKVSVRGAVDYSRHDGYQSTGIAGQNRILARASLLAKPSDAVTILLFATVAQDTGKPLTTFNTNPFRNPADPFELPAAGPKGNPIDAKYTYQKLQTQIVGANIDLHAGDNVFTFIPGYIHIHDAQGPYYQGSTGNQLQVYDTEDQYSGELRWTRHLGRLQLSAGAIYLQDNILFDDSIGTAIGPNPPFVTVAPVNVTFQTNKSYAAYGQAVYTSLDSLRITAGARVSRDRIDAAGLEAISGKFTPFSFHHGETHPDYKLGVDFDLAPRILLYVNAQTGYIPFGYNPDFVPAATVPTSKLLAFSGGIKSRFLDNRLEINAEGYHYDYRNFQAIAFIQTTATSTILQAKRSEIYGADVNLRAQLPLELTANIAFVVQSARYTNFSGIGYNYSGNQMIDAPKFNLQAGLQQVLRLGSSGTLTTNAYTHYESGHYGNFTNFPLSRQSAYTKTDLTLTYTPPSERWSLQGFVNNLENSAVYGSLSQSSLTVLGTGNLTPPRTFGARLTANWK